MKNYLWIVVLCFCLGFNVYTYTNSKNIIDLIFKESLCITAIILNLAELKAGE